MEFIKAVPTALATQLTYAQAIDMQRAKKHFVAAHPEYRDPALDSMRKREFGRLRKQDAIYLDYTGGCLYPRSLVDKHTKWLNDTVAGNPHSTSPASLASSAATEQARLDLLRFFDADPEVYDVVWTNNASAGFRIVGDAYNWTNKTAIIPRDAHNSLNSLALQAKHRGGKFEFVELVTDPLLPEIDGTLDTQQMIELLDQGAADQSESLSSALSSPGMVFFTGQSNITGQKLDYSLIHHAASKGWDIGLDAAALAPTTRISLSRGLADKVDYMVVSLYKIMGWPTGVGALILKKSLYPSLSGKHTFFGGNIVGITMDTFDFTLVNGPERFEDGTINYAALKAVSLGLEFVERWMPSYAHRIQILTAWLVDELQKIHYPARSADGFASHKSASSDAEKGGRADVFDLQRLVYVGGSSDLTKRGSTLPLVFKSACGASLNYRFVIWAAGRENISLRGGPCMCNPGASSNVMRRAEITDLDLSTKIALADVGIVRVSLGVATHFGDVHRFLRFCSKLTDLTGYVESAFAEYKRIHPAAELAWNIDQLEQQHLRLKAANLHTALHPHIFEKGRDNC
ncbi:PLP-dependent transferase [Testicularia cyperi]|uniref:PLP-dependent transferase n=1 Tax=Testicularia cyperi TaxID=1882483 RepID=A0A317XQF4_9BASI|nr:PLP-dependent transferase [Testicularia cyperi]